MLLLKINLLKSRKDDQKAKPDHSSSKPFLTTLKCASPNVYIDQYSHKSMTEVNEIR